MASDRPLISFVVAMTPDRVIGRANRLPWYVPADLAHFRRMTVGKPVLMGRRTFESIGRPLPERHNIVVTRNGGYRAEGCTVTHNIEDAHLAAGDAPEIAVISGAQIFAELLPRADVLHLTWVHAEIEGDTFFPRLNPDDWLEQDRVELRVGPKNAYPLTFVTCRRRVDRPERGRLPRMPTSPARRAAPTVGLSPLGRHGHRVPSRGSQDGQTGPVNVVRGVCFRPEPAVRSPASSAPGQSRSCRAQPERELGGSSAFASSDKLWWDRHNALAIHIAYAVAPAPPQHL